MQLPGLRVSAAMLICPAAHCCHHEQMYGPQYRPCLSSRRERSMSFMMQALTDRVIHLGAFLFSNKPWRATPVDESGAPPSPWTTRSRPLPVLTASLLYLY